ncbi:MAG: STAS domain-containing protein [Verrucomicrobiota bacterium]
MSEKLRITQKESGGIDLVALAGEVDAESMNDFKELLSNLCTKRPVKAILDCRGVTHINYQALNLIKHYHRKAWINMGRLTIVGLKSSLVRSAKSYQVDHGKIFDATIDDALAEIKTLIYT